ncbi:MAG: YbfB/YjiJ family MFS transporter [Pseudomonadota bacterium]|nr:YbfB/YjiJ family MFS transporter [Pseudomonadota bacterium]
MSDAPMADAPVSAEPAAEPGAARGRAQAQGWLLLAGLTLGVCVTNGFARFAYGLILPAMREDLGWTYAEAGWLNTANAFGYVFGALATLALSQRVSASRLFGVGMVGCSAFLFATGFTADYHAQTAWRALTGVFGAAAFVAGGALSAAMHRDDPRRNAMAIALYFGLGGALGMVLSGAVLPFLFEARGPGAWPEAWRMLGGASLIFCPLCVWAAERLRPPRPPSGAPRAARSKLPVRAMAAEIAGYGCFGLGYIVYVTFIVALIAAREAGPALVAATWVAIGLGIALSPFAWRGIFARHASGRPLAMVLAVMAAGTWLPVATGSLAGLMVSALLVGLTVFMAPGAVTAFSRRNLPEAAWTSGVSLFTLVFAIGQTIGPVAAGALGDAFGDIGPGIAAAGGILALGAGISLLQRPLAPPR